MAGIKAWRGLGMSDKKMLLIERATEELNWRENKLKKMVGCSRG